MCQCFFLPFSLIIATVFCCFFYNKKTKRYGKRSKLIHHLLHNVPIHKYSSILPIMVASTKSMKGASK